MPDWGCAAWRRLVARFQLKNCSDWIAAWRCADVYRRWRYAVVTGGVLTPLLGLPDHAAQGADRPRAEPDVRPLAASDVSTAPPEPLQLPHSALQPIQWNALQGSA